MWERLDLILVAAIQVFTVCLVLVRGVNPTTRKDEEVVAFKIDKKVDSAYLSLDTGACECDNCQLIKNHQSPDAGV